MFADIYRFRLVLMGAAIVPLAFALLFVLGSLDRQNKQPAYSLSGDSTTEPTSVEKMKETLAQDRKLLAEFEREQSTLRMEVIQRRKLFQDGQISKDQVVEAERSFVAALTRVHSMRESVVETDIAITEAVLGEKVLRMPVLPVNGYSETAELARFNGGFKWSLREAPRIERFFSQAFGHSLPIAAKGQSAIHNRFGFDHRDAMDVALHPDSTEGKALINQLRKAGIPFIAFRSAIPGVSTGPHIHIGKPSGRIGR
jgi:TolA-binding protein